MSFSNDEEKDIYVKPNSKGTTYKKTFSRVFSSLLVNCDTSHWSYRYIILALICIMNVALDFNDDMTDGLAKAITDVMGIDTLTYEYLDGFGTIPNIVMCIIGGYLVNHYLGRRCGLILTITIGFMEKFCFVLEYF